MSGMNGFTHNCENNKVRWQEFKKSLSDSSFSYAQIAMIWDFYVTHSFSGSSGQERKLTEYGWGSGEKDLKTVEKELMLSAGIAKLCCIRSKGIDKTLSANDFVNSEICVEHPRIILRQNYTLTVDENETIKFAGGGENRIVSLFRHIRNAFAHSNTYFFDNGNMLLEDKEGSKVTAKILIKQQTLLDWIAIIDKNQRYYVLVDPCAECKSKENENGQIDS